MARKVGNVHRFADYADTTLVDFAVSGCAAAAGLAHPGSVGRRIYRAVARSRYVATTNTNLGIAILLGPLVSVEGWHILSIPEEISFSLQKDLPGVLHALTVEDAKYVYEAIRMARPGGLGDAPEQDVRDEPTVTLLETMKLAADRDLIARQYATDYADIFDYGVPAFLEGVERFGSVEAGIIHCQLEWLASYPDSLIARKNGTEVAEDVRRIASDAVKAGGLATPNGRRAGVELDSLLRSDGNKLNPGTTADLITACLFVALRENKVTPAAPFRWDIPDWL
jgi:triphosphoribosyl-dephospho-CoA synthase